MRAIRLHGPADLRLEDLPSPGQPGPGQVLIRNRGVGICGSDLHTYLDARIGDIALKGPLILGHEFGSVVEAIGPNSLDGHEMPLAVGAHVAVDPAQPCGHCEHCEHGHPNLCRNIHFCGTYPDDGALCDTMLMPARCCFPISPNMDFGEASLLESLGVALHAVDLARIHVGDSAAIIGAGPIGLLILQVAKLAGASPIFISDKFPWRLKLAEKLGGIPINADLADAPQVVSRATNGRGVDVAIEAAWADQSVQQAADMTRVGGRMVVVGISSSDQITLKHSTVRRKGMTIRLSRRMKHVYPRAIDLYKRGAVDLASLITHRFPLEKSAEAFAMNARYESGVVKIIIDL